MFTCEGPILPYVEEVGTSQQKEDDSYICPMFTCEGPILPNVEEVGSSQQKEDDCGNQQDDRDLNLQGQKRVHKLF